MQGVLGGIARGIGLQLEAFFAYFISLYIIAIPLAYYLALKTDIGLFGLWIGLSIGLLLLDILLIVILIKKKWKVVIAIDRIFCIFCQ